MSAEHATAGEAEDGPAPEQPRVQRPLGRWLAVLALALAIPLAFAPFVFRPDAWPPELAPLVVREAQRAVPEAGAGGAESAGVAWRGTPLPYRCPDVEEEEAGKGCRETFRIAFRHPPEDERAWALYIPAFQGGPSFQGGVEVSLNGAFLASSRGQQPNTDVHAILPMLVALPAPPLRPGDNECEIVVERWGLVTGFLDQVAVGPDALLRPDYNRRLLLLSTLRWMLEGWQIAMGVAMILIWLARPRERVFLVFGAILMATTGPSLVGLLGDSGADWAVRLANLGRTVAGSLLLPLAWLFVGRTPPIPIPVFLLPPAILVVCYAALPFRAFAWVVTTLATPLVLALAAWAFLVVCRVAVTRRDTAATLLVGAFLAILVFGVHDWLILRGDLGTRAAPLAPLAVPFLMTAASGALIWRFGQAMNRLDRLGARLQDEVAAATAAFKRSFAREREQERKAVLEGERVRLMSDLHDGIAGQLVSILALCELEGRKTDGVTGAVRWALTDLRLVVASLEDAGDDLGIMLAMFRERIEPQLAAHGVALAWRMAELPDLPGLHPGATLSIFRILQEAATNAARHSGASKLTMTAEPSPLPGRGVRLGVRDRGRGGVAERRGSHGLNNMRRRAEALGADLSIASGPEGTTVTLDLPSRLA